MNKFQNVFVSRMKRAPGQPLLRSLNFGEGLLPEPEVIHISKALLAFMTSEGTKVIKKVKSSEGDILTVIIRESQYLEFQEQLLAVDTLVPELKLVTEDKRTDIWLGTDAGSEFILIRRKVHVIPVKLKLVESYRTMSTNPYYTEGKELPATATLVKFLKGTVL